MMHTTVAELREKEIINLSNGHRLGFVYDAEISMPEGGVKSLLVPGTARFFGIFGREEDTVIPWEQISKIGTDIILVDIEGEQGGYPAKVGKEKKRGIFF